MRTANLQLTLVKLEDAFENMILFVIRLIYTSLAILLTANATISLTITDSKDVQTSLKRTDRSKNTKRSASILRTSPGASVAKELPGGASDDYELNLLNKQFIRATIEKGELDMLVRIYAPGKRKRAEFISRKAGRLDIAFIADISGPHRLEIVSLEKGLKAGSYELKLKEVRNATSQDREYAKAARAFADAELLRATWDKNLLGDEIKKYTEAYEIWLRTGYLAESANAHKHIGEVYFVWGEYALALAAYRNALQLAQQINDRLREHELLNCIAYAYLSLSDNTNSLDHSKRVLSYIAGLPLSSQNDELRRIQAQALNNAGEVYYIMPDIKAALNHFNQSLALWSALQDRRGQALAHLNIGYAYTDSGNLQEALEHFKQALSLYTEVDDRKGLALASTAIGGIHSFFGEKQSALDSHDKALHLLRAMGDRQGEAVALNGIGKAYEDLNQLERALDSYSRAMKINEAIHNRDFEALTKYYIGRVYRTMGDDNQALNYYNASLSLSRELKNLRLQAYSLKDIALVNSLKGEPRKALQQYKEVLDIYKQIGDLRGQAYTLYGIGLTNHSIGETKEALRNYQQALTLSRKAEDRAGETSILYHIARAERDSGNIREAIASIEESIRNIEVLRTKVVSPDLRASYFASAHRHYELYIGLLLDQHRAKPTEGFDAIAFEVSERARARSLLEMLNEANLNIRQGADPELLDEERSLQKQLNAKAEMQTRLLSGQHSQQQALQMKMELNALTADYQRVETEIKKSSPRYATLTRPEPLSLKEIQQQVLDSNTLLLEYFLGEERSYVWAVTPSSISLQELPGRAEVESAARDVYELLNAPNQREYRESPQQRQGRLARAETRLPAALASLSKMLLGKVVAQLGRKRLLIVADGALQYVPFAALSEENVPLVVNHELINLPSASTLAIIRKETAGRKRAPRLIALLADPVFDSDDDRVKTRKLATVPSNQQHEGAREFQHKVLGEGVGRGEGEDWPRLLLTRREAEEIFRLIPKHTGKKAMGFEASKAMALSPELASFKIVHFATHAMMDAVHPELSGVILSLVDGRGKPQDGFLRLHEVYNLKLPADLIVLSACQTGLGKEIRGEGLVGLTRGFMYAGAARVVASLWGVRDASTAELMKRFYKGMLKEGKTASAALQAAQVSMWKEEGWQSPFHWAGFVIHGEWK